MHAQITDRSPHN